MLGTKISVDMKTINSDELENPNILRTVNLNLWYSPKEALKNINFEIKTNKVTALIRTSGCGKS